MAGVDVGTAYLTVVPSFKDFGSKLSSKLDSGGGFGDAGKRAGASAAKGFGGSFSSGIKSAVGGAAVLLGGLGAVNFLKDSIGEAREAQKVGALTEQVIKTTGGAAKVTAKEVEALSAAISNKTGVDDEAIQAGANLLLTFKNVRNEAGQGANVFDRATQAAADLSAAGFGDMSATSKQLGKALNDPLKGLTALGKAGVTFSQQQKDQIKTLVESGKTLEAQKIILGEVESQVGGAAAASSTAGEKMKVAFGNVKEQLGTALLPAVDKFATLITGKVAPAISGVISILADGDFTKEFGEAFNISEDSPIVAFLFKIRDTAKTVIPQIKAGFGGLKSAFSGEGVTSDGFVGFMERAGVAARKVFDYLKTALPPIFESAKKLWPSLKQIGTQLFEASQKSGVGTFALLKVALEALPGILDAIVPQVEALAKWMSENEEIVGPLVTAVLAGIAAFKILLPIINALKIAWAVLNAIMAANVLSIVVIAIAALVAGLIYAYQNSETFRDVVDTAFRVIGDTLRWVWNTIIQPVLKFFLEMIANIMRSFGDFLIMLGNVPGFDWAREAGEKIKGAADKVTLLSDNIKKIPEPDPVVIEVTAHFDAAAAKALTLGSGRKLDLMERLEGNAQGTNFWRGGVTLVGEEGPEIVSLPRGSRIFSNPESMAIAGSVASTTGPQVGTQVEQKFFGDIVTPDLRSFQAKQLAAARVAAIGIRQ